MQGVAAIGEVMIELAQAGPRTKALSYAGDTYNTAVYLARLQVPTAYVTRLGQDLYSDEIVAALQSEGIDTQWVERDPVRQPGLYMIHNTVDGERQFSYWRGESAARLMFERASPPVALMQYRYLYLSGISLAILSQEARGRLGEFLEAYRRQGGKVVFDSNYRPRLWTNVQRAREVTSTFLQKTDVALLTLDDEMSLWGDADQSQALNRLRQYPLQELVLKRGAAPALVVTEGSILDVPVCRVESVLDTTAAGDSFNAGYLAARCRGISPEGSIAWGAACAAVVIQQRGAVLPKVLFLNEFEKLESGF